MIFGVDFLYRTDLTIEAAEQLMQGEKTIDGCQINKNNLDGISITEVEVQTDEAAQKIGKPCGTYITIECPAIRTGETDEFDKIQKELTKYIVRFTQGKKNILIVGLGNRNITPDALGPKVTDGIIVTRHLKEQKLITDDVVSVSAIAPGVLGITGIETGEIINSVVQKTKPDIIIAIDALAARSMERVTTTIQIGDTGIIPGSGIGNSRNAITKDTLGVPVIAIGVPTVVDAATVANDSIDILTDAVKQNAGENSKLYKAIKKLEDENRYSLIKQVLTPYVGNLIVTPTEIDSVIDDVSDIIADSINSVFIEL